MRTWYSSLMWLPDPQHFVAVNYSELCIYADKACKVGWDKREFRNYVMYYFLTRKGDLTFQKDKGAKLSTWLYSTISFIRLKFYREVIKDSVEGRTATENKLGLIPEEYISNRQSALDFREASDSIINLSMFKKYLKKKFPNEKAWVLSAIKVIDYCLKGYTNKDMTDLNMTCVRISQLKKKLKDAFLNFKQEKKLCVI